VCRFLGSLVAALLPTNARNAEAWLPCGIALLLVGILCVLYPPLAVILMLLVAAALGRNDHVPD
jgi:hypothetical protein